MGIQLQKVEIMQVVRLMVAILFMISSGKSFCQDINGQYSYCDPAGMTCKKIALFKNRFTALYSGDLGISTSSSGYFLIIQDTVILFHVNPNERDTITIDRSIKSVDLLGNPLLSTKIKLNVIDEAGQRMPGVTIVLRNQDNKTLKGIVTDKDGTATISLSPFTEVDNIVCSWLSDERTIKIASLLSYESEITVKLITKGIKKSSFAGSEKYLILKSKSKQLSLKKIDSHELLTREKP